MISCPLSPEFEGVAGDAYVTGFAGSTDFPVTPYAFQPTYHGCCGFPVYDAFVTQFNHRVLNSSFPPTGRKRSEVGHMLNPFTGVSQTVGLGIAADSLGNA